MPQVSLPPTSLRERTRQIITAEISAVAMRLFAERGFDATTVEQIAEAAGVSRRSFFTYFGTKEDVVLGDLEKQGLTVASALAARPADEPAWEALRAAFQALRGPGYSAAATLAAATIYHDTPSLRARHLEKHLRWTQLLTPDIERRLGVGSGDTPNPRARALIAAALACLDAAVDTWRETNGQADVDQLFDEAVRAVRQS